jgi:uncharacterized membrane protein YfcA
MALTGIGGGLLSGIAGGGGGAIMIPLMTGVLKMRQHTAHGTSLVIITFAALASAIIYSITESVDWLLVLTLIGGSSLGAFLGARGARHIPAMRLRQVFGIFLLLIAARLLLFPHVDPLFATHGAAVVAAGATIGLAGGLASGALGVGGGSIFVPSLVLLLGLGQHEAQGVSLWVIVVAAAVGATTHYRQGTVDLRAARVIVPAAVPAGIAGSLVAAALNASQLQAIFAAVLLVIGTQMTVTASRRLRADRRTPGAVAITPLEAA